METFFDVKSNQPVDQIEVAQGGTKILRLAKFDSSEVAVRSQDYNVAFCDKVIHLKDSTKRRYNDQDLMGVAADTIPVESNNSLYFQICGNGSGNTEVTARFRNKPDSYARPVSVTVTENKKRLVLFPSRPFDRLWANHPLNPINRDLYRIELKNHTVVYYAGHPCRESTWLKGQCMVRFCTALDQSGVKMDDLIGQKCGLPGRAHKYHFIDPADFERSKRLGNAYVWEAKPPLQAEPMPGIAAYYFTMSRRGVILFENYWSTNPKAGDMAGGHIDLWNRGRMGNTFGDRDTPGFQNPVNSLSAFFRARKIVFWPLE